MPIEIKELIIRATIQDSRESERNQGAISGNEKTELISECVEQVLRIIERKNER